LGGEALVTHEGKQPARDAQRERHHRDLQQQHLRGEPHIHAQLPHHGQSLRALLSIMRKTSASDVAQPEVPIGVQWRAHFEALSSELLE
jgi:hypothetical protein